MLRNGTIYTARMETVLFRKEFDLLERIEKQLIVKVSPHWSLYFAFIKYSFRFACSTNRLYRVLNVFTTIKGRAKYIATLSRKAFK